VEVLINPPVPISTSTPINIDLLEQELVSHPCREFVQEIVNSLRIGFHTGTAYSPPATYECNNLLSCKQHVDFVRQTLLEEVQQGNMIGPYFPAPPLEMTPYRVSPIGVAASKYTKQLRLIVDLSSPHDDPLHPSINSLISKEEFSVSYIKVDDAVQSIKKYGRGALLCKLDIRSAYKLCPIRRSQWPLYAVKFEGFYYFQTKLAFGSRSSPKQFSGLSEAIHFIATHNYGIEELLFMLDDFLAINQSGLLLEAHHTLALLTHIFGKLGIPLNPEKTEGPVTTLQFMGVILDTVGMQVRLPRDKLDRIIQMLQSFEGKSKCTKRQLLQLIGHLVFACRVCIPLRSFISRLLLTARGVQRLHHRVDLTYNCKADIRMWLALLEEWNGVSMFLEDEYSSLEDLSIYTDSSSTVGFGGWYEARKEYFKGKWADHLPPDMLSVLPSMAMLELYPVAVACMVWGQFFVKRCIMFHCDNEATVQILTKQRSRCDNIMVIMRRMAMVAVKYNFTFRATWLPSKANVCADALSRDNLILFQEMEPHAREVPCPLPSELRFI
jgi:hypothetical protein